MKGAIYTENKDITRYICKSYFKNTKNEELIRNFTELWAELINREEKAAEQ